MRHLQWDVKGCSLLWACQVSHLYLSVGYLADLIFQLCAFKVKWGIALPLQQKIFNLLLRDLHWYLCRNWKFLILTEYLHFVCLCVAITEVNTGVFLLLHHQNFISRFRWFVVWDSWEFPLYCFRTMICFLLPLADWEFLLPFHR